MSIEVIVTTGYRNCHSPPISEVGSIYPTYVYPPANSNPIIAHSIEYVKDEEPVDITIIRNQNNNYTPFIISLDPSTSPFTNTLTLVLLPHQEDIILYIVEPLDQLYLLGTSIYPKIGYLIQTVSIH